MNILEDFDKKLDTEGNFIYYKGNKIAIIQEPNILRIFNWSELNEDDIRIELINFIQNYPIRICIYLDITPPNSFLICYYLNIILENSNATKVLDWKIFYNILIDTLRYYSITEEYIKENKNEYHEIYRILVTENRNKIIDSL